jgi:chromosomal replication initiation ATPase DnaA
MNSPAVVWCAAPGGIRSCWKKGRGRERWSFDERVLGSSEFVEQVWAEAVRDAPQSLGSSKGDLIELIHRAAAQFGLTTAELCGGTRRRAIVAARRCVAWVAVRQWGGSPTAVGKALGVSRTTVLRAVGERPGAVEELLRDFG